MTTPLETRLQTLPHSSHEHVCIIEEAADALAACREAMEKAKRDLHWRDYDTDYLDNALALLGPAPEEKR